MPVVTEPRPSPSPQSEPEQQSAAGPESVSPQPLRIRYRIRFAKTGLLRWISHRDLARLWERLLRRAHLKLSMTEGFHPKPRVAFPSALALGVEGLDEVVEIELAEQMTPGELLRRLQQDDQPGLTISSVRRLPEQFGKAQLKRSDFVITVIDAADPAAIGESIGKLLSTPSVSIERKKKTITIDVGSHIELLEHCGNEIRLALSASDTASLRPADVLDLLGFGDWIEKGALITRTRVALQHEPDSNDPDQIAVADKHKTNHSRRDGEGN